MTTLVVVTNPKEWNLDLHNVEVVSAKRYLFEPQFKKHRYSRILNLCRSYRYQTTGYYVSLLASARGQKAMPSIQTIQDLKSQSLLKVLSDEVQSVIDESLTNVKGKDASINIYFGHTATAKLDRLAVQIFKLFPSPLLKVQFHRNGKWNLQSVSPIHLSDIATDELGIVKQFASEYLSIRRPHQTRVPAWRFDLAILFNPTEANAPSDEKALHKFVRAAEGMGIAAELIQKDDHAHIAEFDALFIRETTSVNHHTYRIARKALAEGLVVVDDPQSILKCTNKVYLAELLEHHNIPTPKTIVVHKDNIGVIPKEIGTPCILKQPDSSFSQGVLRISNERELQESADLMFEKSDLVIAQEFMPTDFDWRVGIFDRKVLYVCRYHMAPKHWQIIKQGDEGKRYGKVDSIPIDQAPPKVVRMALQAANLIGDSFYGVDMKQVGDNLYVIEINDNPSVDNGYEDVILKNELYNKIMSIFLHRMERRREGNIKS